MMEIQGRNAVAHLFGRNDLQIQMERSQEGIYSADHRYSIQYM
jgi:hypothetical protein